MNDAKKTNQQLIEELVALRQQLAAQDDEKASSSAPSLESLQNQVIGRVRDEIRKMRHSQDVEPLLTATWDGLRALGVPFAVCGVNIINEHTDPPSIVVYHKFSHGELQQYHAPFTEDSSLHRIWRRRQVAYRPDLQQEDPYGEGSIRSLGFRSVVDVPFSHGTLAVSNKDPGAFSRAIALKVRR